MISSLLQRCRYWGGPHKHFLVHQQHRCVRLEVHALGLLDDFQAAHRDVLFVCETEADEVQHCDLLLCVPCVLERGLGFGGGLAIFYKFAGLRASVPQG
jgi:hypothetical protein